MNKELPKLSYTSNVFGYKTESEKYFFTLEKRTISGVPRYKIGWVVIIRKKENNRHIINLEADTLREAKHKVSVFAQDNEVSL